MSISETARLNAEMRSQLSALGIELEMPEQPKRDDKAAKKREEVEKKMFEFPVPIRCCWLFPKTRKPGMRYNDDAYGE